MARKKSRVMARPRRIQKAIDQIRPLQKATAVLRCLEYAAMYQHEGELIAFEDVAAAARALIDQAVDGLDSLTIS